MKRLGSLCKFVHMHIPPKQKNIQGAFPPSVPLLTATAVRLVPAPARHMPANRSLGLRSWCVQLCDRRLSYATRINWVCRCSTGVAYNWSSARRADRPPDRQQHTSDVGRCKSSLGSTCPVSPRHIPSQTHSPQLAARISAGFFAQPAAGVAGVAAGRLLRLAS